MKSLTTNQSIWTSSQWSWTSSHLIS